MWLWYKLGSVEMSLLLAELVSGDLWRGINQADGGLVFAYARVACEQALPEEGDAYEISCRNL